MEIKRREFIRYVGISTVPLGMASSLPRFPFGVDAPRRIEVELSITADFDEMIDGTRVFTWGFVDRRRGRQAGLSIAPGPLIKAFEGDDLEISVTNELAGTHAFAVAGVAETGDIPPGATRFVRFRAPRAGTYLYEDPTNFPVNRVLGLHGALVVNHDSGNTPYSQPTPEVMALFDDFGPGKPFPGKAWDIQRQMLWVFNDIDPTWNARAEVNAAIDVDEFKRTFLPRYFTLNGRSGIDSAHAPDTSPKGRIGEPMLIRNVNAGLMIHGPHVHGNHVFVLARNGKVQNNVFQKDTYRIDPAERVDVLLPYKQPPDIPKAAWPPRQELFEEEFRENLHEPGTLLYPMHPHNELSQTAGGGNYPQGMITDWAIIFEEEA